MSTNGTGLSVLKLKNVVGVVLLTFIFITQYLYGLILVKLLLIYVPYVLMLRQEIFSTLYML